MVSQLRLFLFAILTAACAPALWGEDSFDAEVRQAALVGKGQPAPDFACKVTDGSPFTLSASKGKVTVLFFFSDTGASASEMRYLESEIVQYLRHRDDFQLVGIGRGCSREKLVKMGGENKLTFPLVADEDAGIFGRYFTKFVPRTVVVGRDGIIAHMTSGHKYAGVIALRQVVESELKRGM
ncbi:MAG: peroxiredoxin family protein [Prosthecobacter sp.]